MNCMWCDSTEAKESLNTVYWELPDGTKAIEIQETPCISCSSCGMDYQSDRAIERNRRSIVSNLYERLTKTTNI